MYGNTLKVCQAMKNFVMRFRRVFITIVFMSQAVLSNYLAFLIRFESRPSAEYLGKFFEYLPLLLAIRLVFYLQSGLYKGLWRYASISDLLKIVNSTTFGSVIFLTTVHYLIGDVNYPRSVFFLDWLLFIIISGGNRLFIRAFREYMFTEQLQKRILIIGAGDAGEMIVREMKHNPEHSYEPVGFVDDDPDKKGMTIHGVPILGGSGELSDIIGKCRPDEILVTLSGGSQRSIREIYDICKPFSVTIKKLPGINDLIDGNISLAQKLGERLVEANLVTEPQIEEALALQKREGGRLGSKLVKLGYVSEEKMISFLTGQAAISHMKPISLSDLLQREQVRADIAAVREFIQGKSVMVTGAGGSIGSELCRQIIKYQPSNLLLLDRYENSLFEIDLELRSRHPEAKIKTIIADIQDAAYIDSAFSAYLPRIIFHAAAYKHVPMMEHNPLEAVKNNVFGTRNVVEAAARHCAESFVMISTDKAVNPTSIMGATKRIAEFLTSNMNSSCDTKFTTVRFGNVLGSNGSVVPIFREQLKKGGPLTVTHPEIKRFFMLIPEAVQLVLIAAASGRGGELFVLDMGEPVRIVDLAENFIRLSGFVPHKEIKIEFIGLRPGEKLYEDLFDESERIVPTFHDKLMIAVPEVPSMPVLFRHISEFEKAVQNHAVDDIVPIIQSIVPNFTSYSSGQALPGRSVEFLVQ
jgi:FlaA1/EpsC-like NDP-sugar epimerase